MWNQTRCEMSGCRCWHRRRCLVGAALFTSKRSALCSPLLHLKRSFVGKEKDIQHRKSRTPWSSRPTRHRTWGRKSRAWLLWWRYRALRTCGICGEVGWWCLLVVEEERGKRRGSKLKATGGVCDVYYTCCPTLLPRPLRVELTRKTRTHTHTHTLPEGEGDGVTWTGWRWGGGAHAGSKREASGVASPHPPHACASIPFVCLVILNHRARECRPYRVMSTPP